MSEVPLFPGNTTRRLENIGKILIKFHTEALRRGSQSGICLPYALDAGLALLNLPGLTEEQYRDHSTKYASRSLFGVEIENFEKSQIFLMLLSAELFGRVDSVDLTGRDKHLLTDFKPQEKQQILIIPTAEAGAPHHAISWAGKTADDKIIVFDSRRPARNFETGVCGVKVIAVTELLKQIQAAGRPGYLVTVLPNSKS